MATIAGVTLTFALPENDTRRQNTTLGQAQDLTWKFFKHGASDRMISIPLHGLTTTVKDSLATALEADADGNVTIAPDSHVDLGAGAGTSITGQWIDPVFEFAKNIHDSWSGVLNFVRTS
jgi:hypothetical protein